MQMVALCLLTRMRKHIYQWQRWSPDQEYGYQPTRADVQSYRLLSYLFRKEKPYTPHANSSGSFLYTGIRRVI